MTKFIRLLAISGLGFGMLNGCHEDTDDLSSLNDWCEAKAQCEGGNEKDVLACVEDAKGDRNESAAYNCKEQYDQWIACEVERNRCLSDDTYDQDYYSDDDQCNGTEDALDECIEAASAWE